MGTLPIFGESLIAMVLPFILLWALLAIGLYIYTSFAFMSLAKKNKQSSPGIAWIPSVGPLIIAFRASKMHWWPWLLLIGLIIPVINFFAGIVFAVFAIIWIWKLFESVGHPGWYILLNFIPLVGGIIFLVLLGMAAWSSGEKKIESRKDKK